MTHKLTLDFTDYKHCVLPVYHKFMADTSRLALLKGGAGSGKSVACAQKGIYRCFAEPGHTWLVTRKVSASLRDSCYREIVRLLDTYNLTQFCEIRDKEIRIPGRKARIIFKGLDNTEKIKSISGVTFVWVEEATELQANDLLQLSLRVRGQSRYYKQIMCSFNPISTRHWLKLQYYDKATTNTAYYSTTWRDNPKLSAEDIEALHKLETINPAYARIYRDGEWGETKGLIYTNWEVQALTYPDTWYDVIYCGLDPAYNNPAAFLKIGIKDNVIYITDEIYKRGLLTTQIVEHVMPLADKHSLTSDSASPEVIAALDNAGANVYACTKDEKENSILAGIDWLKSRKIIVNHTCVNTIAELQTYRWAEDKNGNPLDKPIKHNDHAMDALRYGVEPARGEPQEAPRAYNPLRR
jgi:phage terminase large subunit